MTSPAPTPPPPPQSIALVGMSIWKQDRIRQMLAPMFESIVFCNSAPAAIAAATSPSSVIGVWATREPPELAGLARAANRQVVRIEDGFIRSVGLGADFAPPASIVLDRRGIYFDPTAPSDLEVILSDLEFSPQVLERARRLIGQIVEARVTKYNTGVSTFDTPGDKAVRIFVPGQVEDDRSVILGGVGIKTNLGLLKAVRSANPKAHIVYKPHPDVDAGHRQGAIPDDLALAHADQIARGVSTPAILDRVDQVHTITSLAGFEALLRGKAVTTYGLPFYAGWGLTHDQARLGRRTRTLDLNQLVAGALIHYPCYYDPATGRLCEVEQVIERLAQPQYWRPSLLTRARRFTGKLSAARRRDS